MGDQMVHVKAPKLLLSALAALLCAGLLVPATGTAAKRPKARAASVCTNTDLMPAAGNLPVIRAAVLCLHNKERAQRGLAPLKENAKLRKAAKGHSDNMVAQHFFDHTAPDGSDMVDRILGTGYASGQGWSLGENIAWGTGNLATAREIHDAWMHSPGHKANILRRQFREIGIGIAVGAPVDAGGLDGATYTADFGVRR
jgi:uncharacterized protein YkwD